MKRKNAIKSLLLASALCLIGGFTACGDKGSSSSGNDFTGFLPGVAVEFKRGELLFLEDFIDYPTDSTYTITLQKKGEEAEDVTSKKRIPMDFSGEYTFTLTIHDGEHAGPYVHTFIVPAETLQWSFTPEPINLQYQTDLSFEAFFGEVNIAVTSHAGDEWTPFIKNIRVGDDVIDIEDGATSFYVNSLDTHYITYGVQTADGQKGQSVVTANVYFSNSVSNLYLNALSEGTHEIAVNGATAVTLNGKACSDVTIANDKIVFDKQTLYKKYAGTNFLSIATASGEVRDTLNVYTDKISFEEEVFMSPDFLKVYDEQMGVDYTNKRVVNKFA